MKTILKNNVHNTCCETDMTPGEPISRVKVRWVAATLCPTGCCGNEPLQGPQEAGIDSTLGKDDDGYFDSLVLPKGA